MVLRIGIHYLKRPSQNTQWFLVFVSSKNQQKHMQTTEGDDDCEDIETFLENLYKKKYRKFIITFSLLLVF